MKRRRKQMKKKKNGMKREKSDVEMRHRRGRRSIETEVEAGLGRAGGCRVVAHKDQFFCLGVSRESDHAVRRGFLRPESVLR